MRGFVTTVDLLCVTFSRNIENLDFSSMSNRLWYAENDSADVIGNGDGVGHVFERCRCSAEVEEHPPRVVVEPPTLMPGAAGAVDIPVQRSRVGCVPRVVNILPGDPVYFCGIGVCITRINFLSEPMG